MSVASFLCVGLQGRSEFVWCVEDAGCRWVSRVQTDAEVCFDVAQAFVLSVRKSRACVCRKCVCVCVCVRELVCVCEREREREREREQRVRVCVSVCVVLQTARRHDSPGPAADFVQSLLFPCGTYLPPSVPHTRR